MAAKTGRLTDAQTRRVRELQNENGRPRIYTYSVQGKTIVGQFRRYLTRQDAACIEKALYEFLTGPCGFITEYGLVPPDGGFRIKWAEPADLLEELAGGGGLARRGEAQRVYADGMTDVEVLAAIDTLAAEHKQACLEQREQRTIDREISAAIRLLEPHHFTIVPPGWRLTATADDEPPTDLAPPGSVAYKLMQIAYSNGLTLIAPPPVDPGGQVRLL